jgi:prepilin-type N-terminal cleavage/methylation domain-containing protein
MSVIRTLRNRLASDEGFTLIEMTMAAALMLLALTMVGGFLIGSLRGGAFASGQSATLNNARNTMQLIEKEIRGADAITWAPATPCNAYTAGKCIVVGAQNAAGGFRTVRYTLDGTDLNRALFNTGTGLYSTPTTVIQRVVNSSGQPVFGCDTQSSLLKVTINLHIEPTPQSNPNLNLNTTFRPRNYAGTAVC